jgi:hypothetical protein
LQLFFNLLLMGLQFQAEFRQTFFKTRLGRFQHDAAMLLAQRRREVLPYFVQRIFECFGREFPTFLDKVERRNYSRRVG